MPSVMMKTHSIIIDEKNYRIVQGFARLEKYIPTRFKNLFQVGDWHNAQVFALNLSQPTRLIPLTYYSHPNLREPILLDSLIPKQAHVVLVEAI